MNINEDELRYIVFHTSVAYAGALLAGKSVQEAEIERLSTLREKVTEVQREQRSKKK